MNSEVLPQGFTAIYRANSDKKESARRKALNESIWNTILETNRSISNTPIDQRFAYQEAPENLQGEGIGGAEESAISPIDLIPWTEMASLGAKGIKAAIKAAPKLVGNELGAAGPGVEELARLARAKKMGFEIDAFHGSNADISEFIPSKSGEYGPGIYFTSEPKEAGLYALGNKGNITPVKLKVKNPYIIKEGENFWGDKIRHPDTDAEMFQKLRDQGYDAIIDETRQLSPWLKKELPTEVLPWDKSTHYVIFEPNQVRSKFATFDPSKADSANILAELAAMGLWGEMAKKKSKSPQEGL
jgi:hypothetical protein